MAGKHAGVCPRQVTHTDLQVSLQGLKFFFGGGAREEHSGGARGGLCLGVTSSSGQTPRWCWGWNSDLLTLYSSMYRAWVLGRISRWFMGTNLFSFFGGGWGGGCSMFTPASVLMGPHVVLGIDRGWMQARRVPYPRPAWTLCLWPQGLRPSVATGV